PPILFHLYRRNLWGASYTPREKALSKIPKRLRGDGMEVIERLIKRGLLIDHKGGKCVFLNTGEKEEIMRILKDHYSDYYF
ncbi:MAG: hypothetical protein ACOCTL_04920, partial [Candidatus Hadarchaeota archaeon]